MFYLVRDLYRGLTDFVVEVDAGTDDGLFFDHFTLSFPTPAMARGGLHLALAEAAEQRWGVQILEATVRGSGVIPDVPPRDEEGFPLTKIAPTTLVGLPAVTVIDIPDEAVVKVQSWQIKAPPSSVVFKDILVGGDLVGPKGQCFLAGGEYRVRTTNGHGAEQGSALHLAIVDRDDVLGAFALYGLSRTKMAGLVFSSGAFAVGDELSGASSGSSAEVLSVGDGEIEVTYGSGPFEDGEVVSSPSGASALLGDWVEGDVVELSRIIRDEWLEDLDQRDYAPGGSKRVPKGLYLRVIGYNNHAQDELRVKVSLTFGSM